MTCNLCGKDMSCKACDIFPKTITIDKPWGNEIIWANTDKYIGKILTILAGKRLSLQHHEVKEETMLVIEGSLKLTYGDDINNLKTKMISVNDIIHLKPKMIHRIEAINNSKIIEISTTELNDIIRHSDDYGR